MPRLAAIATAQNDSNRHYCRKAGAVVSCRSAVAILLKIETDD